MTRDDSQTAAKPREEFLPKNWALRRIGSLAPLDLLLVSSRRFAFL